MAGENTTPATSVAEEVMTYDEAYYLDVEETKADNATADIQLMNVGVTKFEENANPT